MGTSAPVPEFGVTVEVDNIYCDVKDEQLTR